MRVRKLDDICDFVSGLWSGKKPPYISVGVIRNTNFHKSGNLDFADIAELNVEVKQFSTRQLKCGDIVLEKSGGGPKQPVGRVCVFERKEGLFSLSNFTSAIRVKDPEELDYKYLHYFLTHQYINGETEKIQTNSTGIRNLQLSLYKQFEVPIPPLSTQKKIVQKIEAIFSQIDIAIAAAEGNVKSAESLFQSYLTKMFESNNKDWVVFSFDELVADKQIGLVKNSQEQIKGGDFLYFKMNNITNDNQCDLSKLVSVSATDEEVKKYSLIKDDFLFNTRNSLELVGKACVFDGNNDDYVLYNNNIMRVRFKQFVNPYFILFAFSYRQVKEDIEKLKTGATNVAAIYYKDLKDLRLNLPNIEEQFKIVEKLNELNSHKSKVLVTLNSKRTNFQSLKKAILKQAFNGELVKD